MSDREPKKVFVRYANLQEQIKCLLSELSISSTLEFPLKRLQETLCSMEPMVYDMELSEAVQESRRHNYTRMFLSLVKKAKNFIGGLLKPASSTIIHNSNIDKLGSIRDDLKNLFNKYVKEELQELAVSATVAVAGEQDEMALQQLVLYLGSNLRNQSPPVSSKPVLRKIAIILDSLKQESDKRAQLLLLLNEVKLLLRFLNGDHDLDMPHYLHIRERELREFVSNVGLAQLKKLDQLDAGFNRWWVLTFVTAIIICYFYPPKGLGSLLTIILLASGICLFIDANMTEAISNSTNSTKSIEELMWFFIIVGGIAIAIFFQNKTPIALLIAVCCCFLAYCTFVDGSSSKSTNSSEQNNLNERKKYDIFLNFRGSDVRNGLAGLFYSGFEKENISLFFDESSIPKSAIFWEEIKTGINNSIGAITIFSKNYANSEDCLDELVLIKQRAEKVQEDGGTYKIRPIFYDIPTADLEPPRPRTPEPESKFRQDLKNHDKQDKLVEWEAAISYVLSINGDPYESERQHIYKLINDVVKDFKNYIQTRDIQ